MRFLWWGRIGWATFVLAALGPSSGHCEGRSPRTDAASSPAVAGGKRLNLRSQLAWQLALEREGFSPGLLDGKIGPKTRTALEEFQRSRGLAPTGEPDTATAAALGVAPDAATRIYIVSVDDADRIAPLPKTWPEKAKAKWLGYESVLDAVAERFHCTRALLGTLNRGVDLSALKPGVSILVPNLPEPRTAPAAHSIVVDLSAKQIRVRNRSGSVVALFHCSVAARESNLPTGETTVQSISEEPTYLFDPKMWPEVTGVDRKLLIPPGPRNPVGLCWIGLGLPGYGIHGTPNPELIGKTGSHGCIRLSNWDAIRLSKMVRVGTPVQFVGGTRLASRAVGR